MATTRQHEAVTTEQNTDDVFEETNNIDELKSDDVTCHNELLASDDIGIKNVRGLFYCTVIFAFIPHNPRDSK